jgi:two-component system chemotaxis sensor kinase CheA
MSEPQDFQRDESTLALIGEFVVEAEDGLGSADRVLLRIERSPASADDVNALFRCFHTIKGVAGFIGVVEIAEVAHVTESLLDDVRSGRRELTGRVFELIFESAGLMRQLITALRTAADSSDPLEHLPETPRFLAEITAFMAGADAAAPEVEADPGATPAPEAPAAVAAPAEPPPPTDFERDDSTLALVGEFIVEAEDGLGAADRTLMRVEKASPTADDVNALFRCFHTIKGVAGFIGLTDISQVAHATESLLDDIRSDRRELKGRIFEFVFEATGLMRQLITALRTAADSAAPLAEVDGVRRYLAALTAIDDPAAASVAAPSSAPTPAAAPVVASTAPTAPTLTVAAAEPAAKAEPAKEPGKEGSKIKETLKVDVERVDSFVELIGELLTLQSMVVHAPEFASLNSSRVHGQLAQLTRLTRTLQDHALHLRMVPLQATFQKLSRLVRELAKKTGKEVCLEVSGENTEMDRSMVEQLHDPLVHMIRNAVDHGIEGPADRVAAGKAPMATLRLSASQTGGSIVIELADDGRGLQRDRILAKAREKGIVKPDEHLSDGEIDQLIFAPGFSTAAKVSEISGRGVGMDVVSKAIQQLRGRIDLTSQPGHGTRFAIRLPLTLAVIDGIVVSCGSETYIIPSLQVLESVRPRAGMVVTMHERQELLRLRGEIVPMIRLGGVFGVADAQRDPTKSIIVVVEANGGKLAVMVDEVVHHQQVVIKALDQEFVGAQYLAGAAILSSGRVGLILHLDNLVTLRSHHRPSQAA